METLQELIQKRDALEREIVAAQGQARKEAIAKVLEMMSYYGLSTADLVDSGRRQSRGKVAPKFVDKATGETWSGRGLKPKWLTQKIAAGAKIEDFAV